MQDLRLRLDHGFHVAQGPAVRQRIVRAGELLPGTGLTVEEAHGVTSMVITRPT